MTTRHACRAAAVIAVIAAVPYGSVMIAGPLSSARQNPVGFPQLFDEYRHGEADHAIETFAMWDRGRIEREANALSDLGASNPMAWCED